MGPFSLQRLHTWKNYNDNFFILLNDPNAHFRKEMLDVVFLLALSRRKSWYFFKFSLDSQFLARVLVFPDCCMHCLFFSGQNKNHWVLWYMIYRVANGLNIKVLINFLLAKIMLKNKLMIYYEGFCHSHNFFLEILALLKLGSVVRLSGLPGGFDLHIKGNYMQHMVFYGWVVKE